jgi:predicted alpha/beta superfamily hydrolase
VNPIGISKLTAVTLIWLCLAQATNASANTPPQFVAPDMQTHTIQSKFVDQVFKIYVQVPWSLADGSERFPALYLTDSYGGMAFDDTTRIMQLGGDVPRFITVGIGYEMESSVHSLEIRQRDLTSVKVQGAGTPLSALFEGAANLQLKKKSGGAADFLKFIQLELQPFIDAHYPTDPKDRGYWGDSLGGLFGLYVLFNEPQTFNRYIIGSPSIWWADRAIMRDAKKFVESHDALDAKLYMAVGALEEREADEFSMVTNMFQLAKLLRDAKIEGLQLTTHLFPNETHTSVIGMNFSRGIQEVYDRPVQSFLGPPAPAEDDGTD